MFGFIFLKLILTFLQRTFSNLNFKFCNLKANGNAPMVRPELSLTSFTSLMYHSNAHVRDSSLIKGPAVDSCQRQIPPVPCNAILMQRADVPVHIIPDYIWW